MIRITIANDESQEEIEAEIQQLAPGQFAVRHDGEDSGEVYSDLQSAIEGAVKELAMDLGIPWGHR